MTQEQLIATFLATPTYLSLSPTVIGALGTKATNLTFVQAVYQDVFGSTFTPPSSTINHWVMPSIRGAVLRYQFALAATAGVLNLFAITSDPAHGVVNALYNHFLGRDATTAEMNNWQFHRFPAGAHDQDVIAFLIATQAYFYEPHIFP